MKKGWKITAVVDGIALVILLGLMAWLNNSPASGPAALTDVGWFVVCFGVFQVGLVLLLILGIVALVKTIRKK